MPGGMQALLLLAGAIIILFAVVMVLALRYSKRTQARNVDSTTAASVWSGFGRGGEPDPGLLYGTWQVSTWDVMLAVKDAADKVIGEVRQRGLDTSITVGPMTYQVIPQMHWREAADLVANDANSGAARVLCSFAVGAHRLVTYTCEDGRTLTIQSGWTWPWRRHVSTIQSLGDEIGALWTPGSPWLNQGRALLLPVGIPLPVRLFVLWKGSGLRTRPVTR